MHHVHCFFFPERNGDEYLGFIPEMIPSIAELLDDDVPDVERQCKRLVTAMEKVLGEPLQRYF